MPAFNTLQNSKTVFGIFAYICAAHNFNALCALCGKCDFKVLFSKLLPKSLPYVFGVHRINCVAEGFYYIFCGGVCFFRRFSFINAPGIYLDCGFTAVLKSLYLCAVGFYGVCGFLRLFFCNSAGTQGFKRTRRTNKIRKIGRKPIAQHKFKSCAVLRKHNYALVSLSYCAAGGKALLVFENLCARRKKLAVLFRRIKAYCGGNGCGGKIAVLFAHSAYYDYYIVIRNSLRNRPMDGFPARVNAFSSYICDSEYSKLPLYKLAQIFLFDIA